VAAHNHQNSLKLRLHVRFDSPNLSNVVKPWETTEKSQAATEKSQADFVLRIYVAGKMNSKSHSENARVNGLLKQKGFISYQ
jgi:hypothetical protein